MNTHYIDVDSVFDINDGNVSWFQNSNISAENYPNPQKKSNDQNSTSSGTSFLQANSEHPVQAIESQSPSLNINLSWIVIDNSEIDQPRSIAVELPEEESADLFSIQSNEQPNSNHISENQRENSQFNDQNQPEREEIPRQTPQHKQKNDTKNVPKGFMKAYAHMVLDKNPRTRIILERYFESNQVNFVKYKQCMRKIRESSKISIKQIRDMLESDQFAETTRKLGFFFLRTRFLSHIFNSKMEKKQIHMKYIPRWLETFKDPSDFTSLK